MRSMGDLLDPGGNIITWNLVIERGFPEYCHRAFDALEQRIIQIPQLATTQTPREFFEEDANPRDHQHIWQYTLPPANLTAAWIPFMDRTCPVRMFTLYCKALIPTTLAAPDVAIVLRRIVVLALG